MPTAPGGPDQESDASDEPDGPEGPGDDPGSRVGEHRSSPSHGRRRFRDHWVLLTALSLLGVVLVTGTAGVLVLGHRLQQNIESLGDPFVDLPSRPALVVTAAAGSDEDAGHAMNILVVGSDSRISAGDPSAWEEGAQRTDVIMLVHLPADRSGAYLMSVPRDSWVDVPGHGQAKVNAAFALGGTPLLIETVEQLTGVRVDHVALTDFESFSAVTDALGGVELTLREDLRSRGALLVPAGDGLLTGDQALAYVRERRELPRGDLDRVQRQQAWMRAVFLRLGSTETLTTPARWAPVLDSVSRSVAVDDGFTLDVQRQVITRLARLGPSDVRFFTVPLQGTGTSADGQSIVLLDKPAFDELMSAVASDAVGAYLAEHPGDVENLPRIPR